ncbi:hypothetical protein BC830DRAFT_1224061 [Chytriomyces sp. MP71]|nr:hypothetical protein BC830DRAFT_1224061 [Chytriomyces sp. MP71]
MEAAMKEAEIAFVKRKEEDSGDDEFDGDEDEFGEEDFQPRRQGYRTDVEDNDEEVILAAPDKSKKGERVADRDEDGHKGESADEELASMFVNEDGSDDEVDDDEGNAKSAKKASKPKAGKIQKLANVAKDLGYKGDSTVASVQVLRALTTSWI